MRFGSSKRVRLVTLVAALALLVTAGLTAGTGLAADPDVSFELAQDPPTVTAGLQARSVFSIANDTGGSMFFTELATPIPDGASVVSATPSQGSCTVSGGAVDCLLGPILSGASASVTIFLIAPSADFDVCGTLTWHRIAGDTTQKDSETVCETTAVRPADDPDFRGGCIGSGSTISTGTTATAADPQNTALTSPGGECITVGEVPASSPQEACGAKATCKTQISEIEHPPCATANPCTVTLTFDSTFGKIQVIYYNGVNVKWCTRPGVASPDPCIQKRRTLSDGDNQFILLSAVDARMRGG
jgi:hypothetical protein